jgi:hypothetical protein
MVLMSNKKRAFFSNLNKKDLRISVVFGLFLVPLSLLICYSAEGKMFSFSWLLYNLLLFPINLSKPLVFLFGIGSVAGGILAYIPFFILSFIFKVIIFYSLTRLTRGILGQKDIFLLHHLPSLLICIIFYSFFDFSVWLLCRY